MLWQCLENSSLWFCLDLCAVFAQLYVVCSCLSAALLVSCHLNGSCQNFCPFHWLEEKQFFCHGFQRLFLSFALVYELFPEFMVFRRSFVLFCLNMRELAQTVKVCLSFFLPQGRGSCIIRSKRHKAFFRLYTSLLHSSLCIWFKGTFWWQQ